MVESWIGKPLSKSSNNFFKSSKNNSMVNMFKDNDRDGVPNVFDCKPNDPNKQGLIDAMVGAVKGMTDVRGVRAGWKEGMAKGKEEKYNAQMERTMAKRESDYNKYRLIKHTQRYGEMKKNRERVEQKVYDTLHPAQTGLKNYALRLQKKVQRAAPGYSIPMEMRGERIKGLKQRLEAGQLTQKQKHKLQNQLLNAQRVQMQAGLKKARVQSGYQYKARERTIENLFPTVYGRSKTIQGVAGRGRGRPRGSLDSRYASYGGVYGYRRYLSQQKKALRTQLQQQQAQMRAQRVQQNMPQYEQVQTQPQVQGQQVQQMPQEVQGATTDYSQYQQYQEVPQEMQQVQQQMPQVQIPQQVQPIQQLSAMEQRRPIGTVFRSSGGKPYPALEGGPLALPRQTIPYGYVESVDSFTGRRFLKELPKTERWMGGGQ